MLHWRNQHLKILGILYWGSTYGSCKKQKYVTPWMILVGMHPSNHPQVRKRTSHCSQWPGDGVPSSSSEIAAILISNPIDCFFSFLERVSEVAQLCLTLWDPMGCSPPARLLCLWDSPGKNTGVGCHFLHQGIFCTAGSNPGLQQLLPWQACSFTTEACGKPQK